MSKVAVMFVCLGNICRSPAGEEILRDQVEKKGLLSDLRIESCGTGDWHLGSLADSRMREAAEKRGLYLRSRAQQFRKKFFEDFHYILAADRSVLNDLQNLASSEEQRKRLFLINDFSKTFYAEDVPDPYFGGQEGFEKVLDMLEEACLGLLTEILEHKNF